MTLKRDVKKGVTQNVKENEIITLLKAVEVTSTALAKTRNRAPDTFVVATIDGKEMWKSDVVTKDINPKWVMSNPIKLVIRPSSDVTIDVFRKSRVKFSKPHNIGSLSDKVVRLVDNDSLFPLGNSHGWVTSIKIRLIVDTSEAPSIDDLGIGTASQELDHAQASLARTANDSWLFNAASEQMDHAIQTAEPARAAAQAFSGIQLIGDALNCLDIVVKFVDSIADAHPMFKVAWTVLSYVYKALKHQAEQDQVIWELSAGLQKMLSYAKACCELGKIDGVPNVIEEAAHLVVEGALLIDECTKPGFISRAVKTVFSDICDRIEQCRKKLDTLRNDLSMALAIDTNQGVKALMAKTEHMSVGIKGMKVLMAKISERDDELLKELKPKGMTIPDECMDDTRRDVLAIIGDWVENLDAPNILWVNGFPGVGKSAIASTLVTELRASQRLGSSFFFMRDEPTLATPAALWCSVAHDLAHVDPSVLKVVLEKLKEGVVGPNTPNVKMLFHHLVEEPLTSSTEIASNRPLVIVVDALDDCGGLDGQRSQHREILLDTIKKWPEFPSRFKLVITSRREDDIERAMTSLRHKSIPLLSGEDVQAQSSNDISLFLKSRFERIASGYCSLAPSWPGSTVIDELARQAAGLFIWAKTVVEFVKQGDPEEQLRRIRHGDVRHGDMTALYSRILDIYFNKPSPDVLTSLHTVAGAIIVAKMPLRREDYLALLPVTASMFDFIHKGLQSVMIVGATLRFNHQSFVDFMTNCPTIFLIDQATLNQTLALGSLRVMAGLDFNMCELETSHVRSDLSDLIARIKQAISTHLAYSCRFWADHLQAAAFSLDTLIEVKKFMQTQFLYWLEALSLMKDVNIGTRVLRSIVKWCGTHDTDTVALVKDAIKFVTAFGSVISQSVPHIYLSALPFAPVTSEVSKQFLPHFPQTLSIVTGKATGWPTIQHVLEGHSDWVSSVAFSPDGKRLVSGSYDKTIRVWDAETGDVVAGLFQGHSGYVTSVTFSPDGTRIASGSWDKTVRVWDAETGDVASGPFQGHSGSVNSVAFSPDGARIVSGSDDKTIRVWSAETGNIISRPFQGHSDWVTSVAFSPDGMRVVSGSGDKTILIWDAETGKVVFRPLQGHSGPVTSVAFSPDGKNIVSGSDDKTVLVWSAETGKVVSGPFQGHSGPVTSVAFSPDGTRIASGSWDKAIWFWNAETGDVVSEPFQGHIDSVSSVAFSPDGRRIMSGSEDNTIRVWDAETVDVVPAPFEAHSNLVTSVAFSPDGKRIVSGSYDQIIWVWNAETGDVVSGPFEGHSSCVTSVEFSPDGKRIVSGSYDKMVLVWNAETGDVVSGPFEGHSSRVTSVAFSQDGKRIASGSYDKTVRIWNAESGKVISGPFEGHSSHVSSVAFSPDGMCIASGSYDKTVRVWIAETGDVSAPFEGHSSRVTSVAFSPDGKRIVSGSHDATIRVWDAETGHVVSGPFEGHSNCVTSVAFSSNSAHIVSGSWDKTIRVWNAVTGDLVSGLFQGHSNWVTSVAFSPDGKTIVSGSYDDTIRVWDVISGPLPGHFDSVTSVAFSSDSTRIVSGSLDKTIRVWNAETGDVVSGPFEGHSSRVTSVAFSPDGKRIVSGSYDKTIRVWDAETGKVISGPFEGHDSYVTSVAFSPHGKCIVSGSYDDTIRIWDAETGDIVLAFEGPSRVTSVAFSPDGMRIVSGSYDKTVCVWDAETGDVVSGPFEGHSSRVTSVAFSPDGKRIVSGSYDKTVRVWDAETGDVISGPFEGHSGNVTSVAFSSDGSHIVSGSWDKTIRVWDAVTGDVVLGPFQGHSNWVTSVAFSPDGTRIVSGSFDHTIRVWDRDVSVTCVALPEFRDDSRMDKGWILGGGDENLLFWVPPWSRHGLCWPRNTAIPGEAPTKLDFRQFVHGTSWQQCRKEKIKAETSNKPIVMVAP